MKTKTYTVEYMAPRGAADDLMDRVDHLNDHHGQGVTVEQVAAHCRAHRVIANLFTDGLNLCGTVNSDGTYRLR